MSDFVRIVEVSPRDGLQNEKQAIATETKIELVKRLYNAGLSSIEATAFVSPKWVPQLADAQEVLNGLEEQMPALSVLVPNQKGMLKALDYPLTEVAIFTAASESFNQKNIHCSIEESLQRFESVMELARQHNIRVRGYVSCVIACPYEGKIKPQAVLDVTEKLLTMGCYEVSLGDTIGAATPGEMQDLIKTCKQKIELSKLAVHCHDTYGQALANVLVALQEGIRTVDSSVAGLGGCPYAPGASGNLASEDLVYMLHGSGYQTNINLDALVDTGQWISQQLQRRNNSQVGAALHANRST